jgi:hypothetical protein
MPFDLKYRDEDGVVVIATSGLMRLRDFIEMAEQAKTFGTTHRSNRYLVDHREMTPDMNAVELMDLVSMNQKMNLENTARVAMLYSENSSKKEDFDFYLVRALTIGTYNFRAFTDFQQAIDWLGA